MMRFLILGAALISAGCGSEAAVGTRQGNEAEPATQSELVAVEFSGAERSLNRLARAATGLGWRVDTRTARSLRILPPPNYNPDQFGLLLQRIDELGMRDIGLRLIGPNGPVGPEG